jgi:hypothetical protein
MRALALCLASAWLGFLAGMVRPGTGVSTMPGEGCCLTSACSRWRLHSRERGIIRMLRVAAADARPVTQTRWVNRRPK